MTLGYMSARYVLCQYAGIIPDDTASNPGSSTLISFRDCPFIIRSIPSERSIHVWSHSYNHQDWTSFKSIPLFIFISIIFYSGCLFSAGENLKFSGLSFFFIWKNQRNSMVETLGNFIGVSGSFKNTFFS